MSYSWKFAKLMVRFHLSKAKDWAEELPADDREEIFSEFNKTTEQPKNLKQGVLWDDD